MKSHFVKREVLRFWPDGEEEGNWVDLLTRLSYGDRQALEEKLVGPAVMRANGKPDAELADLGMAAANIELLKRTIVAWGGPGFTLEDGTVAPINEKTIAELDETGEKIYEELKRRMVKRQPDFTPPPSPPMPTAEVAASTDAV